MTTGSYGPSGVVYPSCGGSANWKFKSWNGSNGKYASLNPKRLAWNAYQVESERHAVLQPCMQWRCSKPGGGTDTRPSTTTAWRDYSDAPTISTAKQNKALASLLDKIKGHSFNLGVNISQAKMAVDMTVSNLGKLGRSIVLLKRGDFRGAAQQLGSPPRESRLTAKDISGRWLELQYGWLPLLSDTHEAWKAYEGVAKGEQCYKVFRSGCRADGYTSYANPLANETCGQPISRDRRITCEMVEEPDVSRSLGLYDPASILWENIPYSFVVDWFVPIGTYLSNINQIPHLNARWLTTDSIVVEGAIEWGWIGPYPICGYGHNNNGHRYDQLVIHPAYTRSAYYSNRSVGSTPPHVPFPSFSVKDAFSPKRIFNAIALCHQRFNGVNPGGRSTKPSGPSGSDGYTD